MSNDFMTRVMHRAATGAPVKHAAGSALHRLYPHLADRQHVFSLTENEVGIAREPAEFAVAAADYTHHVWVHKAVGLIADAIAPLPLRVVDRESKPVEGHKLTALFEHVNGQMSPADLWKWWVTDMLLGGETGFEYSRSASSGDMVEITPRQPQMITVVVNQSLRRYYVPAGYKIKVTPQDDVINLEPDEFTFFKFYNPLNPWRGLAPIQAVRMGIMIDTLAQAWSRLFFKNSARPDFAVIAPEGMSRTEKNDLEIKLGQEWGGVGQAHKPIVLEKGIVDIKPFSFPPKDVEWLKQREVAREEIGAIFGVPDEMMGFGKATFENFQTAREVLWTLTLVPLTGLRDSALTEHFRNTGDLGTDERFDTDLSRVPELQEDLNEKLEQGDKFFSWGVPFNTINAELNLGIDEPVPGGELPYAGRTLPLAAAAGQAGAPRALAIEARTKQAAPLFGSEVHVEHMKRREERQEPFVVTMRKELKRQFQRQQLDVQRRLREERTFGRGRTPDEAQVKQGVGGIFDLDGEIKRFMEAFREVVTGMVQRSGELEAARLGTTFDITRPAVQAAIEAVLKDFARKVNNTTFTQLTALFQEAESNGESIAEIQERLAAFYGGRKSDFETERIARTTMVAADNQGAIDAYEQSGEVAEKVWLATLDDRTRDAHIQAHGQKVALNETFTVGGEELRFPGDPNGSAGNVINCRCAIAPVLN
jgi:HK97 family phage portal protein